MLDRSSSVTAEISWPAARVAPLHAKLDCCLSQVTMVRICSQAVGSAHFDGSLSVPEQQPESSVWAPVFRFSFGHSTALAIPCVAVGALRPDTFFVGGSDYTAAKPKL